MNDPDITRSSAPTNLPEINIDLNPSTAAAAPAGVEKGGGVSREQSVNETAVETMSVSYEEMIAMATDPRDQKFIAMLNKVTERLSKQVYSGRSISAEEVRIAIAEINVVMTAIHYRKMDAKLEDLENRNKNACAVRHPTSGDLQGGFTPPIK